MGIAVSNEARVALVSVDGALEMYDISTEKKTWSASLMVVTLFQGALRARVDRRTTAKGFELLGY